MRAYITFLALLAISINAATAQTWAEWFKQKKTQQKYLIQQIAGLQVYIEFARKGYEVTTNGINTVKDIKNGDFKLHAVFFKGLGKVNPKIKDASQAVEILFFYQQIIKAGNNLNKQAKNSNVILPDEMGYLERVIERLKQDCSSLLDGTFELITNGALEMSDDERINRLTALLNEMESNYTFLKTFNEETIILIQSRKNEIRSIGQTIKLFGEK